MQFEAAARFHLPPEIRSITAQLFEARRAGSRFLSDSEWELLTRNRPFWLESELIAQCQVMSEPWSFGTPSQHSRIVLFDARVLQPQRMNGTKNHARALLDAFLSKVPSSYAVAFLTDPELPDLPVDVAQRASVDWRPALIGDVDLFVQLATITNANDPVNVDLLRAPWIRRISVFLDDIQGLYPAHFAGTEHLFWLHQLAIEKLRTSDIVLALGATSRSEAESLWSTLDVAHTPPVFLTTSCLRSMPISAPVRGNVAGREIIVFGNYHPHKNVALAASVVGIGREIITGQPTFTFIAELSQGQRSAITELARQSAGSSQKDGIAFASGLSEENLVRRIQQSRAVIIPSLHEGFSIPVIDAIGLGVPVLLSRIDAHLELLPEGPWFFDSEDVQSLTESLVEFESSGSTWSDLQREALEKNYSPDRLGAAVGEALQLALVERPLRTAAACELPRSTFAFPGSASPAFFSPRSASHVVTREHLTQQDNAFMSATLSMLDPDEANYPQLNRRLTLFKNEHDNIVAEFHSSVTWRVGKVVTAPLRWFKTLTARK